METNLAVFEDWNLECIAERLGVRNWRIKAKDRDGWRRLLESAKILHGCSTWVGGWRFYIACLNKRETSYVKKLLSNLNIISCV
jgi:hypothetical protein